MFKKFAVIFVLLAAVFVLTQYRWLSVGGINPDLFLVALLFFTSSARRFPFVLAVIILLAAFIFLFTPQWAVSYGFILILALASFFLRRILTGTRVFDFLGLVFLCTVLFYLANGALRLSSLSFSAIFLEAVYNLILAALLFAIGEKLKIDEK